MEYVVSALHTNFIWVIGAPVAQSADKTTIHKNSKKVKVVRSWILRLLGPFTHHMAPPLQLEILATDNQIFGVVHPKSY